MKKMQEKTQFYARKNAKQLNNAKQVNNAKQLTKHN